MSKGFYVHLPFCETRCRYCRFVAVEGTSPDMRARFWKAFFREMEQARAHNAGVSFDTLYLGGGTPSCLSAPELERLIAGIHTAFQFRPGYEFTCEFNPGDGDQPKIQKLRELGVNRVSLGCQSFQDGILRTLGRRHTVALIEETVTHFRRAGITNVSFDLMLRLPGQTAEDFRHSVCRCVELGASQVSLYDLEVHSETPFGKLQEKKRLELPPEEVHAVMYAAAMELLTQAGYEHYEISNFAKPGLASRHNLLYWHNQEYLGLGPSAFSYRDGVRAQFAAGFERYLEKCEQNDWKRDQEDFLTVEERELESFAMGLRLREGVRPAEFKTVHAYLQDRIAELLTEGLLEASGPVVRLTDRGKGLSEDVFAFLLQKENTGR